MTYHWTEEQIHHQKEVLRNQLIKDSGRFAIFVLRTYRYIEWACKQNNGNWCIANKIRGKKLISYVYDGSEDHMAKDVVEDAKDKLNKMGYIKYKKESDIWRIYILKSIDFCDINQYVQDDPNDNFFDIVYQHLLNYGIKIYQYKKRCWKCHSETDIYTYFLGKQLEQELGRNYMPARYFIERNDLFDKIGIGSIAQLDEYLSCMYPQIQKRFSKEMNQKYYMCCCHHCGAHQGINFTVYRPEELIHRVINLKELETNVIDIQKAGITQDMIKRIY